MLLIALSVLAYALLVFINTYFLLSFSPFLFLITVYLLPLIWNGLVLYYQKEGKLRGLASLTLPSLAAVSYVVFAYLVSSSGAWDRFIDLYTITDGDMTVEIAQNLLDMSQLMFMAVVYYASAALQYFLVGYKKRSQKKGMTYA